MRLWSVHPHYLDAKGLVACWRESLLAKAVLSGKTRGYRKHPQLERFRAHPSPIAAVNRYLLGLYIEAKNRGYSFDRKKIGRARTNRKISVTQSQAEYEMSHLKRKLRERDRMKYLDARLIVTPALHPLFRMVKGGIETWERQS